MLVLLPVYCCGFMVVWLFTVCFSAVGGGSLIELLPCCFGFVVLVYSDCWFSC